MKTSYYSTIRHSAMWLIMVILFCTGCNNNHNALLPDMKFERSQWEVKDGKNFPYRKQMINDLLTNYSWTGLEKDSVIKLLGEPDGMEEDIFMLYHYEQKFLGSFVMSTQSLVIQLNEDSSVKLARTN